jgi:cytochrome c
MIQVIKSSRAMTAMALLAATLGSFATGTAAGEESAERGRALVEAYCARCHAVGDAGESPMREAPPFRTLHERYPAEDLEEALAEGIVGGHPAMPEFTFAPEQVADIIAYLNSLAQ